MLHKVHVELHAYHPQPQIVGSPGARQRRLNSLTLIPAHTNSRAHLNYLWNILKMPVMWLAKTQNGVDDAALLAVCVCEAHPGSEYLE
jgi:hypothetical protein